MNTQLAIFYISLIFSLIMLYIIGTVWFVGKRNRYLIIFSVMGVMTSVWTLLNGIQSIVPRDAVINLQYVMMVFVCCIPFLMLIYELHFINAKVAENKILTSAMILIMFADIALLLTNPLHHQYYLSFDENGNGAYGMFFWTHSIISYIVLCIAFAMLINYVVRNFKKYPHLILVALASACPLGLSFLHVFKIINPGFDTTPIGFIIMFSIYGLFSIRFRLFDLKGAATANIFDTLSEVFLVVNNIGVVEDFNPAFEKTFPSAQIQKGVTPITEVVNYLTSITSHCEPNDIIYRISSQTDTLTSGEISVLDDKGHSLDFALTKDYIFKRNQSAGFVITLSDISNYKNMISEINEQNVKLVELKDMAEAASNSKTAFLANMSHEIRTPMNAIIGMTTIAKNSDDIVHISECLDKIDNASHHLLGLINDVLDMSKIEANKLELYTEIFGFHDMINDLKDIFIFKAEEKHQKLTFTVSEDIPLYIKGDKLRISQIITNLLSNAVKFTPDSGSISLTASLTELKNDEAKIRIEVKDSGIGMNDEQLSRLFTVFEQADSSISRRFGGTGLGLAISKSIADMMGGTIFAGSILGKESTFVFEFPAQVDFQIVQKPEKVTDDADNTDYNFEGYTALLAEDMEINREIIISIMEDTKIKFDCASNGQEAYDLFKASPEKYSIIYMDIHMPSVDGYTATQMIRKINCPQAKTVPIIAMTANAFAEDIKKCMEYGMNDHISKPVDINILLKKTAENIHCSIHDSE